MCIRRFSSAIFFFALLFVPANPRAECSNGSPAAWFFITNASHDSSIPYFNYCNLKFDWWADTLAVSLYAVPFQKARCTVPDPPFGIVMGETWFFPHTGDRATGLEFDMGACTTGERVVLGEIYVAHPAENHASCQSWTEGTGEIQSCEGAWLPADFIPQRLGGMNSFDCICYGWQFCYSLAPYDLYPPDGATNVPLNVVLTWEAPEGWNCSVAIGTDPACTTMQYYGVPCETDAFAPGFLQPYTTYYWTPSWVTDGQWNCFGHAAVRSFTTGEDVSAVERTTWGRVKALYR